METIAATLADAKIPCNAIAAYHHDHLFVPVLRADEAVTRLESLRGAALRRLSSS
ncbi:ACT domain-containing protein [Paraburkholderia sp. USG1]|uniref:ACT domain-containing protein n=1 Tax=Paraburkholderia sp. USG1 TaxID=2952268 RepID=UPI002860BF6F|nr:ACT domain-containing protein [Paraburkholderia sp. USG1]MDR8398419.1 ACT domain-containing protein [Paraburkholderia sp. USG1]